MNTFLVMQSIVMTAVVMCQAQKPKFTKMNLEWDETGQCLHLRRGLISVEGVMPVLVSHFICLEPFVFDLWVIETDIKDRFESNGLSLIWDFISHDEV